MAMLMQIERLVALLALSAACLLPASLASAQGVTIVYKSVPSTNELGRELFGETIEEQPALRTRGLRPQGEVETADEEPAQVEVHWSAGGARQGEPVKRLAFNIRFAFDSTNMLAESIPFIDRLGEVLRLTEDRAYPLTIVGHTDSIGSQSYNQQLSLARAQAVRDYLIANWQVSAGRLRIDGRGESELLSTAAPNDPVHRRVEFWAQQQG